MAGHFTDEQIAQAKETSLTELASYYGFRPKRVGNNLYTLAEHDSIRIYNDRTWCRWSRAGNKGEGGGSQIDFLIQFCGVGSVSGAIRTLLEFQGISVEDENWKKQMTETLPRHQAGQLRESERKEFVLPEPMEGNYRRAYAYLMKTRGLSQKVVDYFVKDLKILYEEKEHHNLVFLGKDKDGTVRYATKRGTADIYGKKYRGDVAGNDKNYGVNIVNPQSAELKVFEANIDLMSYLDITGDYSSNKLVLGMTADNPLTQFLKDYSHIKSIGFCLDNDEAGMLAMFGKKDRVGLLDKYAAQGYETYADIVPKDTGCKDWNEYLVYQKEKPTLEKETDKTEREINVMASAVYTIREKEKEFYFYSKNAGGFSYPFEVADYIWGLKSALKQWKIAKQEIFAAPMLEQMRATEYFPDGVKGELLFQKVTKSQVEDMKSDIPYFITIDTDKDNVEFGFNKEFEEFRNMEDIAFPRYDPKNKYSGGCFQQESFARQVFEENELFFAETNEKIYRELVEEAIAENNIPKQSRRKSR